MALVMLLLSLLLELQFSIIEYGQIYRYITSLYLYKYM
jgi:hypothetical protein